MRSLISFQSDRSDGIGQIELADKNEDNNGGNSICPSQLVGEREREKKTKKKKYLRISVRNNFNGKKTFSLNSDSI